MEVVGWFVVVEIKLMMGNPKIPYSFVWLAL